VSVEKATHLPDEGRAPLEGERHHRDPPAVVLLADAVGDRDAHLVEEHLVEVAHAQQRLQRLELDAR